jgi:DNA-binding transcriptional ArsR family regulator
VRRRGGVHVRGALDAGALSMARRAAKSSLPREALEIIAQRFRALGDATRLALLQALFEGDRTVQELCALTGTSQANASKHLALLLERGLVTRQRDGLFVRYGIADSSLERLCHLVCGSLAEHHESLRASLPS